jgi:predicted nuclease of predicted toxin-antitoxin system
LKFLLDQDIYAGTLRFVQGLGHDVVSVSQLGLSQANDETLLRLAQEQGRIFVTRDRDFGNLVFVKVIETGVLYLRMTPATQNKVLDELERVLNKYSEQELLKSFVVIEVDGHRVRKLPGQ